MEKMYDSNGYNRVLGNSKIPRIELHREYNIFNDTSCKRKHISPYVVTNYMQDILSFTNEVNENGKDVFVLKYHIGIETEDA